MQVQKRSAIFGIKCDDEMAAAVRSIVRLARVTYCEFMLLQALLVERHDHDKCVAEIKVQSRGFATNAAETSIQPSDIQFCLWHCCQRAVKGEDVYGPITISV